MALNFYNTQVRRLLHDPNGAYWSDTELTDYINEARNRICKDTRCLRTYIPALINLTQGVEQYTIANLQTQPAFTASYLGYSIVDVMSVTAIWGQTRIKLAYASWTRFDVLMRYWQTMQSRPVMFTKQGALNIYIGPQPDTTYPSDWDLAMIPPPLVSDSTPEPIPEPFTTPIKYYAAFLAKFREQAIGEAKLFEAQYKRQSLIEASAWMQRIIPDPYAK